MDISRREQFFERLPFLIVLYFILSCLFRMMSSPTLEMDEAEQVLMTQLGFRWTYVSQPPLYTWMQKLMFEAFSPSVFGLVALKLGLLCGTFLFAYHTVKKLSGSMLLAGIGAMGLFLVPQYLWESQRDLTHSVLVTTVTAATVYVIVNILKHERRRDFVLLGLAMSAGMLSKYNYVFPLIAFVLASVCVGGVRRAMFTKRIWLAVLPFVVVLGLQLYAISQHQAEVKAGVSDFAIQKPGVESLLKGLVSLLKNSVAFLAPLLIVAVVCLIGSKPNAKQEADAEYDEDTWEEDWEDDEEDAGDAALSEEQLAAKAGQRFLALTIVFIVLIAAALFAATGGTSLKDRWLQPLFYVVPLYLALVMGPKLSKPRQDLFMVISGVAALVVLLVLPLQPVLSPVFGKPSRRNDPFRELAAKLTEAGVNLPQVIAADRRIGGNLKLWLPDSEVIVPGLPHEAVDAGLPTLLIWDAARSENLPANLDEIAHEVFEVRLPVQAQYQINAVKYHTSEKHKRGVLSLAFDVLNHQDEK